MRYLIFFLLLLLPNKALAQAKFYQVIGSEGSPGIVVIDESRANLTERGLIGIRLNRRPRMSNECGELRFSWNQHNVGRQINILSSDEQGNEKILDIETLPLPTTRSQDSNGCWDGDSKASNRLIATGLQPNKAYIIEERIKNYRNVRFNTCGIARLNTENLISYQENGAIQFEVAGRAPQTPAQMEALFVGFFPYRPICYRGTLYVPAVTLEDEE